MIKINSYLWAFPQLKEELQEQAILRKGNRISIKRQRWRWWWKKKDKGTIILPTPRVSTLWDSWRVDREEREREEGWKWKRRADNLQPRFYMFPSATGFSFNMNAEWLDLVEGYRFPNQNYLWTWSCSSTSARVSSQILAKEFRWHKNSVNIKPHWFLSSLYFSAIYSTYS